MEDDHRDRRAGAMNPVAATGYEYDRYSTLTGVLTDPPEGSPYRVRFRRLDELRPVRTSILVFVALAFVAGFLLFLLQPAHWPSTSGSAAHVALELLVAFATAVIGILTFVNVATMGRASLIARDPIPVVPQSGTRVAFVTTIVPSREPLAVVQRTLAAAGRVRHDGPLDVWLLDEGGEESVREACRRLGVRYFTRHGVEAYNQASGTFKTKSKHGNYNSWLHAHGDGYDVMISVDPDHVPLPNFAERFLGYFRDPDIAFVVGPQVYGNYHGFVTKSAESQQFLFHSLLQRAGNRTGSAMFVGTNNAVRIDALRSVGGLRDSVTEDLATSVAIHAERNPRTGNRWRSVYTPDVIAVGEGPTTFTDFFAQQYRWARGGNDVLLRRFWRIARRLSPGQAFNYLLLMVYYPATALAWTLGVTNSIIYMTLGIWGVRMPVHLWLMLYVDVAVLQTCIYSWNRRHNVSPHESPGSNGVAGMFISALSAPVYVSALLASVLGRSSGFVVTAKGNAGRADSLRTFTRHIGWAAAILTAVAVSPLLGWREPAMYVWAGLSAALSLGPLLIWSVTRVRRRRAHAARSARHASADSNLRGEVAA